MPCVQISATQLNLLFSSQEPHIGVVTALGNTMLEIQGDLQVPTEPPLDIEKYTDENDGDKRFTVHDGEHIVRFGLLLLDNEKKNATLFIGRKQRLLGKVVKLETPLGLLRFKDHQDEDQRAVEMQDIFYYKIIFNSRPLPIM
ncbi:hypothetical protein TPHA_0L00310 [Tetrapisispora phaffii CBS 4417]|uniref:Chromosome transmission fidelity protein 8 n=1 Tax=Tetrapisispora phaffii (strain ATCC 24235 / CBS 4417 / NBRC 1672 / NRRL Y-8282 / UCD 70-5) TaxID=1071381 RepID=G8BZQ9_TETPH|nr:hypothetical protein TPHA_0L00310 [Tetrapisispora phaffii CBS 4417]CCE65387.1 hypothetical protein TPHA_0L00310 [Tetrapisispora phaffii CBS 4417]